MTRYLVEVTLKRVFEVEVDAPSNSWAIDKAERYVAHRANAPKSLILLHEEYQSFPVVLDETTLWVDGQSWADGAVQEALPL